ncbi:hypothetical protein [Mesonia sp. K4-1]|mgnify:CR=1 FL=1|uniref:hypothetical protein n=1 Tax=Mesonia sp. K4-1 TaxID=2602760 RepID=UPI0011C7334B|nr:hypothetical protein [Mesonia sp. K4-1]TXK78496.1 hypothetical protein FT986_01500 [Mesonia sp. K4-1]|tara:strand:- start:520 stop:705 length:186 start_codon:yes stop_codon:yes gene_type:complete
MKLNLLYKIVAVFFIIFHFHDVNYEEEKLAAASYLAILLLLGYDITRTTIKMMKRGFEKEK